ncbi:MAG: glutathione S-transferase family protein [Pseudomonadota bacterium]
MYTLYWAESSGSFVTQIALRWVDAPHQITSVDLESGEHQTDEFFQLNPAGQLPTMVLPDGSILTETLATILHLDMAYPDAGLIGKDAGEKSSAYRWLAFLATRTYGHILRYYYSDRFSRNDMEGVQQLSAAAIDEDFKIIETALDGQTTLSGSSLTIADVYLVMIAAWSPSLDKLMESSPNVARLWNQTIESNAVAAVWAENFPELQT